MTSFRDRAFIPLDTVDSTNNYAANLLKMTSPPDGTVITALEQTHGRGQRGTSWSSKKGDNLLCSMIIYPTFLKGTDIFILSKIVALSIAETIEELVGQDTLIKWPNDIIVREKKIAGILIELNWSDQSIQSAIIGMGINLNQRVMEFAHSISAIGIKGKPTPLQVILDALLLRFDYWYSALKKQQFDVIHQSYRSKLFRLDQVAHYTYQGMPLQATVRDVDSNGQLILESTTGERFSCDLKEVIFHY
ncbi:MAG: biotin--[acetyl-CoA-carboxylase] ligase [Flavobacteriales bacterium]|jgi:BirA family biotin operon repressor/biotin-[acetyl-CoA-carboxylase] ligase